MSDCRETKIYFASPWFSKEQSEREERVKKKLRDIGWKIWSPKENYNLSPISDEVIRDKVFKDNCSHIEECDFVFAITDGKDMGTIWEAGYAYGKNIPVIYYCETLNGGYFNLMLAQSAYGVITSFDDLEELVEIIKEGGRRYVGNIE